MRAGPAVALVGSSLLFGLAHGSIYRLLPTAILGFLIGFVRWRTGSIVPGAIIHFLNNGLALTLLYYRPAAVERLLPGDQVPLSLGCVAAVILVVGLLLMREPQKQVPAHS